MNLGEIQELKDTTPEELEGDLMGLRASTSVPSDEEKDVEAAVPGSKLTITNLAERSQLFEAAWDLLYDIGFS